MRNNIMNDAKTENPKNYVSKFDFSAGNSNSATIGRVDVGFSQVCVPGAKLLIKQEQLVRMAPLVAPSYAKQFFKTWGMQVPIEDVWPNFSPMMTRESVARNGVLILPEMTPYALSNQLLAFCLAGAHVSVFRMYHPAPGSMAPTDNYSAWETQPYRDNTDDWSLWLFTLLRHYNWRNDSSTNNVPIMDVGKILGIDDGLDLPVNNATITSFGPPSDGVTSEMPLYSDDLVTKPDFSIIVKYRLGGQVEPGDWWVKFNFRLSSYGRQIYKNLRGLGYPCDFGNTSKRTLLHLFACYKAYWDIFGLNQFQNWEETYCSRLITGLTNSTNMYVFSLSGNLWNCFKSFMLEEFASMWVTEKDDYVSAHLPQPTISPTMTGVYGAADANPAGYGLSNAVIEQTDTSGQSATQPNLAEADGHAYMNIITHSHLDSEALKRLYKRTNTNTLLGREIAKLMNSRGLGTYMQRTRTNMIGETTLTLDIGPVYSTSDTYNEATEEGANVGDYAGRGVGYRKDDKPMFCKTDSFCFVIVLTAVTADSGYSQGEDVTTACVEPDDFYQSDYEALGQELHSKSVVVSTSDGVIIDEVEDEQGQYVPSIVTAGSEESFGYATRFSGWKVGRSCSNGGFALASTRDSFTPFIGDKLIYPEERFDVIDVKQTEVHPKSADGAKVYRSWRLLSFDNLPVAGNFWRFLMRYPWVQNLLRIFRNKGKEYLGQLLSSSTNLDLFEKVYLMPENYMIFDDFWVKCWAPMLPIAETYGTIDPDKKVLEYIERA